MTMNVERENLLPQDWDSFLFVGCAETEEHDPVVDKVICQRLRPQVVHKCDPPHGWRPSFRGGWLTRAGIKGKPDRWLDKFVRDCSQANVLWRSLGWVWPGHSHTSVTTQLRQHTGIRKRILSGMASQYPAITLCHWSLSTSCSAKERCLSVPDPVS
jgi:hypothetical protein